MITRRRFLQGSAAFALSAVGLGGYAIGAEPLLRLRVQSYQLRPRDWPAGFKLRIAVLADIHACHPWMSPERIHRIVERTNALKPDLTVLMGDFTASHRFVTESVLARDWSQPLGDLSAPLGVHSVLGNHDWWDDPHAQETGRGPVIGRLALENVGITVHENDVVRLAHDGHGFWLAGLGDQLALRPSKRFGRRNWQGVDDLPGTLAKVTDEAPVILLAHEPDIFPKVPDRVTLTLSGHTHGGQVRLFGYSPVVPSRYKNRYAYGHIVETTSEDGSRTESQPRSLIVSGGLGCAIMPVRFGVPPEIVTVDIG